MQFSQQFCSKIVAISPRSALLGMFCEDQERLRLSDRNSILIHDINHECLRNISVLARFCLSLLRRSS